MRDELQALFSENRRLRREVRLLSNRVAAFEQSRWWRLHPRSVLRRRREKPRLAGSPRAESDAAHASPADVSRFDPLTERFRTDVVARGIFTRDTFTHHVAGLEPLIRALDDHTASILEVGSYEGMSAAYFLWRLPRARVTCVDIFERLALDGAQPGPELEATFDQNVALVDQSRVRKLVGDSRRVLLELQDRAERFDMIYVDGSHLALDVVVDTALAWRLLESRGIVVFDDYAWDNCGTDPLLRPGPAIDAMLAVLDGKYEVLARGAQLAIRKAAERE